MQGNLLVLLFYGDIYYMDTHVYGSAKNTTTITAINWTIKQCTEADEKEKKDFCIYGIHNKISQDEEKFIFI